jgi:hypothetical protein
LNVSSHFFSVRFGVQGGFCEQDWVFLWGYAQLVVEGVVLDFFHAIPVGDYTVLDWVLQGEDTTFGSGLIAEIRDRFELV